MNYELIRQFYDLLEDEESRYIFKCRIEYLFTGNREYLRKMTLGANNFHPVRRMANYTDLWMRAHANDGLILYGAGELSTEILKNILDHNINVLAFCETSADRCKEKNFIHLGYPLISLPQLLGDRRYSACPIVISTFLYQAQIADMLLNSNISHERLFVIDGIYNSTNYVYKGSYFSQEFLPPIENEVYVDAGCYDGNTIRQFSNFCKGNYVSIFGFEPHPENYKITIENIDRWGIERTNVIQKGSWSSQGEYSFVLEYGTGAEGARISDGGQAMVETTSIDSLVGDSKVTFIKMDAEGAELESLKGAINTISKHKPRLAVCVYHKPEDILEIPEFLMELNKDYKYYLRHHNYLQDHADIAIDTVLYAV
ncbi:MAG: FkbM family methyltransferase [Clostridiales Family XIII bacterium]|jgi:FkbM family methyltransferase|nr:FkbM family methyltransferase [Clostridiales Family XIII bacterium]